MMIILGIILLSYLLIKLNKDIRLKAYDLFIRAEHHFGSGTGKNKMKYVIENLYRYLPNLVTIFISTETLQKIVQKFFNEIKDLLDDGKRNKSIRRVKNNE